MAISDLIPFAAAVVVWLALLLVELATGRRTLLHEAEADTLPPMPANWPPPLGPRLWADPPYVRYPDSMPFPPIGRLRCLPKGPDLIPPEPVEYDAAGAVVLWADQVCACGHTWGEHRRSSIYDDHPFCHACAIEDRLRVSGGES